MIGADTGRFGRSALLVLRYLMALFFAAAATNKWRQQYLFTDRLHVIFTERLTEIDPESFGAWFLEHVGLPHYPVFAAMVCLGETAIALGLLLGCVTRGAALGAMLMMFSFAIGGYYDASLLALGLMFLPLVLWPTGLWFGLDRHFHTRWPRSVLFK